MSIDATNQFNSIRVDVIEEEISIKVSAGLRGPVGFEYIGEYSAGTKYYSTNVVKYSNALYIGLPTMAGSGVVGELPTNTTYWAPLLSSTGPFEAIASQAEAEAGIDNTKGMTPLRVNNAVSKLFVGADAQGDMYYKDGGGNFTRLPIGVAGQHLTVNSASTTPEWAVEADVVSKTADYTTTSADGTVLVICSSVNITITLPAAASLTTGKVFNIKKVDSTAFTVIIDGNATETIDGDATFILLAQYENLTIQSDGSNWHVL